MHSRRRGQALQCLRYIKRSSHQKTCHIYTNNIISSVRCHLLSYITLRWQGDSELRSRCSFRQFLQTLQHRRCCLYWCRSCISWLETCGIQWWIPFFLGISHHRKYVQVERSAIQFCICNWATHSHDTWSDMLGNDPLEKLISFTCGARYSNNSHVHIQYFAVCGAYYDIK